MSAIDEFEEAREDLELLLVEVLSSVFAEEAMPVWDDATPPLSGTLAVARLEIHDEVEGSFTVVEVRLGAVVARVLASRMLMIPDPTPEDLLDAVGELGNIAGGNVKSLLRHSCRLSLPTAEIVAEVDPHHETAVVVRGGVLGQVIELSVRAAGTSDGAFWPGAAASVNSHAGDQGWTRNDVLESQS